VFELSWSAFFGAIVFGFGAGLGWALAGGLIAMLKR
jgi:Na+-transporting NADH:ubiquinone oxidoreductase subunit NqrE